MHIVIINFLRVKSSSGGAMAVVVGGLWADWGAMRQ